MLQSVATAVVMAGYAFLCVWKRPFLDRFEFFLEVALAECTLGSSLRVWFRSRVQRNPCLWLRRIAIPLELTLQAMGFATSVLSAYLKSGLQRSSLLLLDRPRGRYFGEIFLARYSHTRASLGSGEDVDNDSAIVLVVSYANLTLMYESYFSVKASPCPNIHSSDSFSYM